MKTHYLVLTIICSWGFLAQAQEIPPAPNPKDQASTNPSPNPYEAEASRQLLEEALQGNFQNLTNLLTQKADPNTTTQEKIPNQTLGNYPQIPKALSNLLSSDTQITPLMAAASYGNPEACQQLINAGAKRWAKTKRWKTTAPWLAGKIQHIETIRTLLLIGPDDPSRKTHIFINTENQTGELYQDEKLVMEFTISTGRKGYRTKPGKYVITEKDKNHVSSIYHVPMNNFLRCSFEDFGIHQGYVPGYPASHGCIRTPKESSRTLFKKVPTGSTVTVN